MSRLSGVIDFVVLFPSMSEERFNIYVNEYMEEEHVVLNERTRGLCDDHSRSRGWRFRRFRNIDASMGTRLGFDI